MTKVKITSTVSFTKEFIVDLEDYPDCKTTDDVVDMEKEGISEDAQFIVDGGEMKVEVMAVKL